MSTAGEGPDSAARLATRPSLLRTFLTVAASIGTLLGFLGLAVRPGVSPAAQLALAICGFAGYVALVGPALDRRYRLDRKWRQDPPDLHAFRERSSAREKGRLDGRGSSGKLVTAATLAAGLTLGGDVATAVVASPDRTDAGELSSATPAETPEAARSGPGLQRGVGLAVATF